MLNQRLKICKMNYINWKGNIRKKVQNFVLILNRSWKATNVSKLFSKYLKYKICKIKPFPSHMLMIRKQNIVVTLLIFLNQLKTFMKNLRLNRQPLKVPLLYFLAKFLTEKKFQINDFTFDRLKFLLEEVSKSIHFHTKKQISR